MEYLDLHRSRIRVQLVPSIAMFSYEKGIAGDLEHMLKLYKQGNNVYDDANHIVEESNKKSILPEKVLDANWDSVIYSIAKGHDYGIETYSIAKTDNSISFEVVVKYALVPYIKDDALYIKRVVKLCDEKRILGDFPLNEQSDTGELEVICINDIKDIRGRLKNNDLVYTAWSDEYLRNKSVEKYGF